MKRNVLVIAGLAVLSTSAFASKARIEALGQALRTPSNIPQKKFLIYLGPCWLSVKS